MTRIIALLALFSLSACMDAESEALQTARRFVDAHYVVIDLQAALPLTAGPARAKVQESIRLTEGFVLDAATRKPQVGYKVLHSNTEAETATHVFAATIRVDGAGTFEQEWIVVTRRIEGAWRVSHFSEKSAAPAS